MQHTSANFNFSDINKLHLLTKEPIVCSGTHVFPIVGIFYGQNPLRYSFPLMLLEVSAVVITTQILRFLLKPFKQPRVISEILSGVILGPSVLSSSKRLRKFLFPTDSRFVLKNLGLVGFFYFLFVSGVKTDFRLIKKAGRKQWIIALFSVFIPLICTVAVAISLRNYMDKGLSRSSSILGVSSLLSVTAFPVIHPIISEFNLLSSEMGRFALSTALITEVIRIAIIAIFEASEQGSARGMAALWSSLSVIILMLSIFGGFRQAMFWIVRTTPEGKPIAQIYVIAILLAVLVMGFFADMLGVAIFNGPMWLGLAVPDGPPLGEILVEKAETIVINILMPVGFIFAGLITDMTTMSSNWANVQPLFLIAITGVAAKLIATFSASYFLNMPLKESLAVSLLMNLRGQMELLMLLHLMDFKIISVPNYSMMVLIILVVTAVSTPLISILYDPTRPYMVNKRRNIQHNPPNSELRVVACFPDHDGCVAGVINLLEVSNSVFSSPISVYALHLVELIARATPVFIEHKDEEDMSECNGCSSVHKALKHFQETRSPDMKIHHYTSITAKRTMYQDICELALLRKASLIMLPFDKELTVTGLEAVPQRVQPVNIGVLDNAPCSVAIFADQGFSRKHLQNVAMSNSSHHFTVFFMGGADSREALSYADRMSTNTDVRLTVIRFLSHDEEDDDKLEKKLDDGLVTSFWVKNETNSRVTYREVVVKNGEETVAAIHNMTKSDCDLFIVGRRIGINPVIVQGLSDWNENHELGIIGDYVASANLGCRASLLVVQQQILRG